METENQETERRKVKDGTGTGRIKTGIMGLNYNFWKENQRNRQNENWEFEIWCT